MLAAIGSGVRPGGLVVIVGEAVAAEFQAPGEKVDRLLYGGSLRG